MLYSQPVLQTRTRIPGWQNLQRSRYPVRLAVLARAAGLVERDVAGRRENRPAGLDLLTVTGSPEDVLKLVTEAMIAGGWLESKEQAAREETRKAYQKKNR